MSPSQASAAGVLERLRMPHPLVGVELRPPRRDLSHVDSMDTWIDMYHAIRRLVSENTLVFLTDNAVGQAEEENLQHLTANLSGEVDAASVVPFLTCKHTLAYCLMYAKRVQASGIEALAVLGGDQTVGAPRCVPHAYELRAQIRVQDPGLMLGGWANPHKDPCEQVDYLLARSFGAEFYLTQIVSHHSLRQVERFLNEAERRNMPYPGVFGVFHYRSAKPATLARLNEFFPVPMEGVTADFASGLSADEICARSVRELRALGVQNVYVSNLGVRRIGERYRRILDAIEG